MKPDYLPKEPTKEDRELFEFLMSLRWGQDYGADVDKYSAKYQEIDSIFEGSEDIVPSGMDQIVKILETGLHIELEKPVKRI